MKIMFTPRERVSRAIERKTIDRVPMRYNGRSEVDEVLADYMGIPREGDWQERMLRELGIDFRNFNPSLPQDRVEKGKYERVKSISDPDEIRHNWPDERKAALRDIDALKKKIEKLDSSGDPPCVCVSIGGIFTDATKMIGVERLLYDIADESTLLMAIFDEMERWLTELVDRVGEELKGRVDMIHIGDDLGTQQSLFISPGTIEKHLLPRYKRIGERIHAAGAKYFFHCCGAIHNIIPMFIEAGVDVMNPVQPCHPLMEPEVLARDFGEKLTFCGGIDMQHLLPFGKPEEIAAEVRRYINELGKKGGYILDSANILHTDNPPRNIEAMFRAGREFALE